METETNDTEPVEQTTSVEVPEDTDPTPTQAEDRTPVDRPSRKERREAKKFDFNAEIKSRDEELGRMRNGYEQMGRELAELRGRMAERDSQNKGDPYAKEIEDLEKAAKADLRAAAAAMKDNPQEAERLVDEHNKKLRKIARIEFKQEQEIAQAEQQKNNPQLSPQETFDGQKVVQEYPWIATNAHARSIVDDLISRMTGAGSPRNYTTFKAAAAYVAQALNLGGHQEPTNGQRQRYTGNGAGEAGGGGGEGTRRVEMGRHEIALARAMANRRGKGETDEEAQANWAKNVGTRIRRSE